MELPLGEVPVTEDTRLACEAAGIPAPVTELAAQSALAILRELTDPDGGEPPCHAKEFSQEVPRVRVPAHLLAEGPRVSSPPRGRLRPPTAEDRAG